MPGKAIFVENFVERTVRIAIPIVKNRAKSKGKGMQRICAMAVNVKSSWAILQYMTIPHAGLKAT
jgi:hypothetical protein